MHEAELRLAQSTISSPMREVREQHSRRVQVVEREVTIRDASIELRIWRGGRELERRAGERTGAERALRGGLGGSCKPRAVAIEHLDPLSGDGRA